MRKRKIVLLALSLCFFLLSVALTVSDTAYTQLLLLFSSSSSPASSHPCPYIEQNQLPHDTPNPHVGMKPTQRDSPEAESVQVPSISSSPLSPSSDQDL